jgi:hypothetical protein
MSGAAADELILLHTMKESFYMETKKKTILDGDKP